MNSDHLRGDTPAAVHEPLRIFILLPTLNPYGGVVSVVNLTNSLITKGHTVALASLSQHTHQMVFPYSEPIFVTDRTDLLKIVGPPDFAVATSWHTVGPILFLADMTGAVPAYFVQDFEPDLEADARKRSLALGTYDLIPNRIVKTSHLQRRLMEEGGWSSKRIAPGLDLDLFYPRQPLEERPPDAVLAMARPDAPTDHRGFAVLRQVLSELHHLRPSVQLRVFGPAESSAFDAPVEAFGLLPQTELPILYSEATVFVDTSLIHGFGRAGVEAMACGTPCVLADSGGPSEYARHMENALVVPSGDSSATVEAITTIMDNPSLANSLAREGLSTVREFSDQVAADEFEQALRDFRGDESTAPSGDIPLGESLPAGMSELPGGPAADRGMR